MKIVDIRTTLLEIPAPPTNSALGVFATFDYGIVEVVTDEGIVGLGEISTLWDGKGRLQAGFVDGPFREALMGMDPFAINDALRRMRTLSEGAWAARAAVEMAMFDIVGTALNTPVSTLLGGRVRDRVELSRSVYIDEPTRMAAAAGSYVEQGFTCVKVKVGRDLDDDVRAVAAIRDAIGDDVLLRVDANMGWPTPKDAIRAIRALEGFNIHSVEQPLPRGNVEGLAFVRGAVDVPIMADEDVWGPEDARRLLEARAVDYLNIYVAESGGLSNAALIFKMAELHHVPCVLGAMPELGVGAAAVMHLAVAMPNLGAPCDAAGSMYQDVDVVEPWLTIEQGSAVAPTGPGLGVRLDRKAMDRFAVPH